MFIANRIGSMVSPVGAECSDVALPRSAEKFGNSNPINIPLLRSQDKN